jgi:streptogrisin D
MRPASALLLPCHLASAIVLAAWVHGCDLNPQPLPPGETPDGSLTNAEGDGGAMGGEDAAGGNFGGGPDASTTDAAAPPTPPDAGADAGAGDAGEAGDAAAQDAGDAGAGDASAEDAPSDAPHDGEENGG